jgi:hypothetical protein
MLPRPNRRHRRRVSVRFVNSPRVLGIGTASLYAPPRAFFYLTVGIAPDLGPYHSMPWVHIETNPYCLLADDSKITTVNAPPQSSELRAPEPRRLVIEAVVIKNDGDIGGGFPPLDDTPQPLSHPSFARPYQPPVRGKAPKTVGAKRLSLRQSKCRSFAPV